MPNVSHTASEATGSPAAPNHPARTYAVHIGTLELKYKATPVPASTILEDAGFTPPEEYVLELLRGAHGPAEREFASTDQVPLDDPHARHFRAVPRGGGRA